MHRQAASCRFTVLGPPGLTCDGAELDLGAPQQQAVLLVLLANPGRFVRVGELIDGLWGERAPATGEAVIRTYISRLRRLLSGPGLGRAIRSRSGGYLLDPALLTLDAAEFTQLVEAARQERAGGNVPAAAKHLEEALDLWTGTALAGVPGEAADRERSRLERLKLIATQELFRLRLELGQHAEVAAEVPSLLELNRLEEPLYEIHLLALQGSGRRAEALEVYRTVYDLLDEELGISPGPRLREIHQRILRGGPALARRPAAPAEAVVAGPRLVGGDPAPARRPAAPAEAPGAGPRLVGGDPASARRPAAPAEAPVDDSRLVGRDAERAAFSAILDRRPGEGPEVLFVRGAAGIGKSTLLRRFAGDAAAAGRTVWYQPGLPVAQLREALDRFAADALPGDDAAELFDWLRAQPYVETPGHGLDITGVLREALDAHLRWRDPAGYERMRRRIRGYVCTTLLRDTTEPRASVAVVRTLAHPRRRGGVLSRYVSAAGEEDVRAAGVTPDGHDELVALAWETYGEVVASSVRFWLERRPEAFTVLRCRRSNRLRAFMSWLTVAVPAPGDPVLAAAWADATGRTPLPPGARIAVARHLICPADETKPNPRHRRVPGPHAARLAPRAGPRGLLRGGRERAAVGPVAGVPGPPRAGRRRPGRRLRARLGRRPAVALAGPPPGRRTVGAPPPALHPNVRACTPGLTVSPWFSRAVYRHRPRAGVTGEVPVGVTRNGGLGPGPVRPPASGASCGRPETGSTTGVSPCDDESRPRSVRWR
ncbi:BTAD domain-containing putative transcriptional regulator [Amycolatopsis sp. A133]|uniref:BTAD domain-containing putative transcriptional regulator n=1 Tax=Amycolatopsis sp. A133 TaxID=3064472 RepID=UPI0027FBA5B5|nr:BTAD domain-containing putative transcriptional regulator [Amycolatopsis sp. A133]MDQ7808649.1 BTAD domain-containing putative transcriptional regulator [Amycolatopsis sp. A133]